LFVGFSASGKSSLVFGAIAAESQRLISENYSAFVLGFMPTLSRPDFDVLEAARVPPEQSRAAKSSWVSA
jgi:excinuclease UvrABC ATPase subunit